MIVCLWGYSLLSGASPSVIRAAGMFSITLFAKNIFRETTLYNILAASAFLLLCFDPFWIFDTGFQLSYAAVLSLGLFSKPIRDFLPLQNKTLRVLWNAASVSMAAQILTTPISIYYFNRFPTYFLVANLVAVPLSSLILAGGILLCACSPIHPLAQFVGWILGILIKSLNGFIRTSFRIAWRCGFKSANFFSGHHHAVRHDFLFLSFRKMQKKIMAIGRIGNTGCFSIHSYD